MIKIKKILLNLIWILFYIIISFDQGIARDPGDWVGNGASFSENLVSFAYENLSYYLKSCKDDKECSSAVQSVFSDRPNILSDLISNDELEVKNKSKILRFMPQSSLFIIDGSVKVAITGLNSGDPIFINTDLLVEPDPNNFNNYKTISLERIISILVHEVGHHLNIEDHHRLDKLGAVVSNQYRVESLFLQVHPKSPHLGAQYSFAKSNSKNSFRLALVDSEKYIELSEIIRSRIQCPQTISEELQFESAKLWNIYWENPNVLATKLIGYMVVTCRDSEGRLFEWAGDKLIVQPMINNQNSTYRFEKNNLDLKIESCHHQSGECEFIKLKYKQYLNHKKENL